MPEGEQRCPYHHSPEPLSCERRRPPQGIYEKKGSKFLFYKRVVRKHAFPSDFKVWEVGQGGFQSDRGSLIVRQIVT